MDFSGGDFTPSFTPKPGEGAPNDGGARATLRTGGIVAGLIIALAIIVALSTSGPGTLGGLAIVLAAPLVGVIVMGAFSCVAIVLAIRADSMRYVIQSAVWIVLGVIVIGGFFALVKLD